MVVDLGADDEVAYLSWRVVTHSLALRGRIDTPSPPHTRTPTIDPTASVLKFELGSVLTCQKRSRPRFEVRSSNPAFKERSGNARRCVRNSEPVKAMWGPYTHPDRHAPELVSDHVPWHEPAVGGSSSEA